MKDKKLLSRSFLWPAGWFALGWILLSACAGNDLSVTPTHPGLTQSTRNPGFILLPMDSIVEEVSFNSVDGVQLAGQFDWPLESKRSDLIFIIHHADPITRDNYQFLAAKLVPLGYVVFRFDKRGTGSSRGEYGCCEAEDAIAAYQTAVTAHPERINNNFIIAQSIGTQHLANRFSFFSEVKPPTGVILLSSLLSVEEVLQIKAPLHIVMSDSEPSQIAEGEAAVIAHQAEYSYGASLDTIENTEHTLFDIREGMINWDDPDWPEKFSEKAWISIKAWLETQRSK